MRLNQVAKIRTAIAYELAVPFAEALATTRRCHFDIRQVGTMTEPVLAAMASATSIRKRKPNSAKGSEKTRLRRL